MAKGKNIRSIKGPPEKDEAPVINPGNIPILTVKLLDQINKNILELIKVIKDG